MKFRSKRIGDLDLKVASRLTNTGKQIYLVPHKELLYTYNALEESRGLTYKLEGIYATLSHNVFICEISDKFGVKIQAVGEVTEKTTHDAIQEANPAITASQRAFDRAFIMYLQLNADNVYSVLEIDIRETKADIPGNADKKNPNPTIKTTTIENKEEEIVFKESKPEENIMAEEIVAKPNNDCGSTMVTFGKYMKVNKTIAEIAKTDRTWLERIVKINASSSEEAKEQQEQIKKYLASNPK